MGFFGQLVDSKHVEIDIPGEYSLYLSQACIEGAQGTLYVQCGGEEESFALCQLNQYCPNSTLQHKFGPEDSPLTFWSKGGDVHLTGLWTWELGENDDNSVDSDAVSERCCSDDKCVSERCCSDDQCDLVVEGKQIKKSEQCASVEKPLPEPSVEKSKKENKKKRKAAQAEVVSADVAAVVEEVEHVVQAVAISETKPLKKWKVKPQNNEGIQVLEPRARTFDSGVVVCDYVVGNGPIPKLGSKTKIVYEAYLPETGALFDQNLKRTSPLVFRLGTGQVIRGLELGLDGMKTGGSREIVIPPTLGYGKDGCGDDIPPNQTLLFRVTLVGVAK